jgi:uncharacterized SAM-binding protein YcdF (DUF218 family)
VLDELTVRYACRALVLPPGGPLLLALAGVLLLRRAPRSGRALAATGLLLTLLLSLPVVADALTMLVQRSSPPDLGRLPAAGAIVVLGGGVQTNTADGEALTRPAALQRLVAAAALARRTGLPLLLAGGVVEEGPAESATMQRELNRAFGLTARWLDGGSRTTRENARESAALLAPLGIRRVLLVTSAIHMRRATGEFEAAGLQVVPVPVGALGHVAGGLRAWLPSAEALAASHAACYEVAGSVVASLDGGR